MKPNNKRKRGRNDKGKPNPKNNNTKASSSRPPLPHSQVEKKKQSQSRKERKVVDLDQISDDELENPPLMFSKSGATTSSSFSSSLLAQQEQRLQQLLGKQQSKKEQLQSDLPQIALDQQRSTTRRKIKEHSLRIIRQQLELSARSKQRGLSSTQKKTKKKKLIHLPKPDKSSHPAQRALTKKRNLMVILNHP